MPRVVLILLLLRMSESEYIGVLIGEGSLEELVLALNEGLTHATHVGSPLSFVHINSN